MEAGRLVFKLLLKLLKKPRLGTMALIEYDPAVCVRSDGVPNQSVTLALCVSEHGCELRI